MTLEHNTLGNLFEDIADAIREKNPSAPVEDSMVADTFPTEIRAIPSGGGGDEPRMEFSFTSGNIKNITMYNMTKIPIRFFDNWYVSDTTNKKGILKLPNMTTIPTAVLKDATNTVKNIEKAAFITCADVGQTNYGDEMLFGLNFINANNVDSVTGEPQYCTTLENISPYAFMVTNASANSTDFVSITPPTSYSLIDLKFPDSMKPTGLASASYAVSTANNGTFGVFRANGARFQNNFHLRSVEFPKQITDTGQATFRGCQNLTTIIFPNDSEMGILNAGCFADCTALTEVTIPASVYDLKYNSNYGGGAFANCTSLAIVKFLGTPSTFNANTFAGCTALADIYVPWAEGAVAGAPWGAPNSPTIHYNWTPTP